MVCKACGRQIVDDSKFCCFCGENVGRKFCSQCGSTITADNKFCPKCGTVLEMDDIIPSRSTRSRSREMDTIPLSSERETRDTIFSADTQRITYEEETAEEYVAEALEEDGEEISESCDTEQIMQSESDEQVETEPAESRKKTAEEIALEEKWDKIFAAQKQSEPPKNVEQSIPQAPAHKMVAAKSSASCIGTGKPVAASNKSGTKSNGAKGVLLFLSFIIPLAGLILFVREKTSAPLAAKAYLKTAILSVVIYFLVSAVCVVGGLAYMGFFGL